MRVRPWIIVLVAVIAFAGCASQTAPQCPCAAGRPTNIAVGPAPSKAAVESPAPVATAPAATLPAAPETAAEAVSWNKNPFADAPEDFHFAVVSDNAGGRRPGVFQDAIEKLNLLRPSFVMCVGDLVEGYAANEAECKTQFDELAAEIAVLNAPFFGAVGNHDVSDDMMSAYVEKRFGPLYYSFIYKDVLFIILNTQDDPANANGYRSGLREPQVDFVAKTLAANPNARWTFVFMHQPLFAKVDEYATVAGWPKVEEMLAPRPHTVFAGHWHEYAKQGVNGHAYYRLATTGGDSKLTGADRGEFDEIVWVTVAKDGPVVANLDLSGIYRDDVSTDQTTLCYEAAAKGTFLKPLSVVTPERPFTSCKTKIEFKNDTGFPLTIKASFAKSDRLLVEPSQFEAAVKPHSTDAADVRISAPAPVDPDTIEPFTMEWSGRYELPGRKPIEGSGRSVVVVEGIHPCPKAASAVKVDGDLSDWPALPERFTMPMEFTSRPELWTGPDDASIKFAAAYDDEFLYLAFAVADDHVVVDDQHNARQEDALTILVDPRSAGARTKPEKDWKKIVAFVIAPGAAPGKETLGEPLPEGTKAASVITPTGYNTEIAIPVALVDKIAGGPWQDFRLNIRLHDLDTPNWDTTLMWWRPAWDGPLSYPDSGTFKRE